jgi:hypothetical protein
MTRILRLAFLILTLMLFYSCTKSILCKPNSNWRVYYYDKNPGIQEIIDNVPPDLSAIIFIREFNLVGCAGRMYTQIDGEEVGPVASYTHVIYYVPPGMHEVTSSKHSIWSPDIRSASGKIRFETFPGRAYFVSGIVNEGMVAVRQLSVEEAGELLKESRQILTPKDMKKQ